MSSHLKKTRTSTSSTKKIGSRASGSRASGSRANGSRANVFSIYPYIVVHPRRWIGVVLVITNDVNKGSKIKHGFYYCGSPEDILSSRKRGIILVFVEQISGR